MPKTSGHWIGDKPVLTEDIAKHPLSVQRAATLSYLSSTHMNLQHHDMETLERRANAHQQWNETEHSMLGQTHSALNDHSSPHFQLSSHMIHNERRLLADRANMLRGKDQDVANTHLSEMVENMTGRRAQGSGPDYNALTDMLIHGKQGPLTEAQSRLGVEATVVGHYVARKNYGEQNPRMEANRPFEHTGGGTKRSHPSTSPHGVDLSQDEGTMLRDKMGLPVMMGTSGSASDVARSYLFTAAKLSREVAPPHAKPVPQSSDLLADLTFHWMRAKAPMGGVKGAIAKLETTHDLQRAVKPPPMATQTHTYAEIAAGIDLSVNKKMSLQESTQKSLARMEKIRPSTVIKSKL